MPSEIVEVHYQDKDGNPTGGVSKGRGFHISWQDGPLKHTDPDGQVRERKPTGAFVEDIIAAALGRIQFYQAAAGGKFACGENVDAIACLEEALRCLEERTKRREIAGIEGTYQEEAAPVKGNDTDFKYDM